jgi:hypothetical protein
MKRYITVCSICMFLMCLLLSGCYGSDFRNYIPGAWDPDSGKRPTDYGPSKWIYEDPNIWFEVPAPEEGSSNRQTALNGEIKLEDKIIKITVFFNSGRTVFITKADTEDGLLLTGLCTFNSEKLVVEIDKKDDVIFGGQYDEITFVKAASE